MYIEAKLVKRIKVYRETETDMIRILELVFKWRNKNILAVCKYPLAFEILSAKVGDKLGVFLTARTEIYKSELSGEYEPFVENYVVDVSTSIIKHLNRNH